MFLWTPSKRFRGQNFEFLPSRSDNGSPRSDFENGNLYDLPSYSRVLNKSVDALIKLQVKTHGVTCLFDATRLLKFSKLYLIKVDFGAISTNSGRYYA